MKGIMRDVSIGRVLLLAAVLLGDGGVARAEDRAAAKEHYLRAVALVNIGEHRQAITEFQQAYVAAPQPSFLYNIAVEYRTLAAGKSPDDMKKALEFFRRYLQAAPQAPDRAEVESWVANLEAAIPGAVLAARQEAEGLAARAAEEAARKRMEADSMRTAAVQAERAAQLAQEAARAAEESARRQQELTSPTPSKGPPKPMWKRWQLWLGVAGGVVATAAIVGGAVGGTRPQSEIVLSPQDGR